MDEYCGSYFWDLNVTWYTDQQPNFTECFQKTVLIWTPCLFLWIFMTLQIYYISSSKCEFIPLNLFNKSKLVIATMLIILSLTEVLYSLIFNLYEIYIVDIVSPAVKIFTFMLVILLEIKNRKAGIRSSGVLFIFWLLLVIGDIPYYARLLLKVHDEPILFIFHTIYFLLIAAMCILNCFADAEPLVKKFKQSKNTCPEDDAPLLSKLLYAWFEPLIWKGYRNTLDFKDLWSLSYKNTSAYVVPIFNKYWNRQISKVVKNDNFKIETKDNSKKEDLNSTTVNYKIVHDENSTSCASIIPPVCLSFLPNYTLGALLKVIVDLMVFANPQILGLLIRYVNGNGPFWRGFFYAFVLFIVSSIQTLILSQYFQQMFISGMRIRTALTSAIFRKALRISSVARRDFTLGEIVNLMSVDVQRLADLTTYINLLWSAPLQITLAFIFLWQILGPSVLAGIAVMIILIPVNALISSRMKKLQINQLKNKDKRIKLMNEILSGLKVLKLYAWEPSFEKQIENIREKEIKLLKDQAYFSAVSTIVWTCAPFWVSLVTFAVYVLSDEKHILNAETAFVSLSFFNILRFPLSMLPLLISNIVQAGVSVKRINKFLNSSELQPFAVTHRPNEKDALVIENGFFTWGDQNSTPILKNINLRVQSGSLVAVVGSVGSGKSSLISAFLGEMCKFSGYVNTKGSIAYVPQQAWIQNATLRSNITFADTLRRKLYDEVIIACALKCDLEILPAGDLTEIGEKGINLSGGQKQRISLARAVYSDADIYFLDDPLSAVDSHVGNHIFEHVIGPNGLLKNKTRLLVTHSITHLTKMDLIVVLKDGVISEMGTYQGLLDKNGDFADFLLTYIKENKVENEQDVSKLKELLGSTPRLEERFLDEISKNVNLGSAGSVNSVKTEHSKVPTIIKGQKLIEEEKMKSGTVEWSVYVYYFSSVGSLLIFTIVILMILFQTFSIVSSAWLSFWSSDKDAVVNGIQDVEKRDFYLSIYALLGLVQVIAILLADVFLRLGCWKTSRSLHRSLLSSIMKVPVQFIDTTPIGRILSRFTKDLDIVDNKISDNVSEINSCFFEVCATIFIISYSTPTFIFVIVPIGALYYFVQILYIGTSRQLKRLESVSRSPIYSHFGETVSGAQSIRAYGLQNQLINESEKKLDANQMCYYPAIIANRWLSVRLETIGNLITFLAAFFGVLERDLLTPGLVGLSISYALQINLTLNWLVRMACEVETNLVAVERIQEYSELPQEPKHASSKPVPTSWPDKGEIVFQDYKLRFREDLNLVLKGLSFKIESGEKVGIVGRTGAGKSSLTLGIFRMIEAADGKIIIDGIDTSTIDLHVLRSRLTIIPQEPVLFSSSLRINLDPFEEHSDDQIWSALELSHLKKYIASLPGNLQYKVTESGENFSVGQRQLICLARALLRKTKILILDEATAAVDLETDDFIQSTIRREFSGCTILTVAHRLNTIMDYDRIIVLDQGRLVEFDTPTALLKSKRSVFYSMALEAGLV